MRQKPETSKNAADKLVKNIRRKTRQTYSAEEKIRIVLAGLRGEESISVLCRREGIATFELVGMRRDRVEHILHTFFKNARADISVPDRFGRNVRPREWFYVRPDTVARAVAAIKDGSIVGLEYDVETQSIRQR